MAHFGGVIPEMALNDADIDLLVEVGAELSEYEAQLEAVRLRDGVSRILAISRLGNQYLQANAPWVLVKGSDEEK